MLPGILPHKKKSFLLISLKPNIMRTILLEGKSIRTKIDILVTHPAGQRHPPWQLHNTNPQRKHLHLVPTMVSYLVKHPWPSQPSNPTKPIAQSGCWPLAQQHPKPEYRDLANTFSHDATNAILQVPTICSQENNILRWKPATKGTCTTKEAYLFPKFATAGTATNNGQHKLKFCHRASKHSHGGYQSGTSHWRSSWMVLNAYW